jgi:hypothetical protein
VLDRVRGSGGMRLLSKGLRGACLFADCDRRLRGGVGRKQGIQARLLAIRQPAQPLMQADFEKVSTGSPLSLTLAGVHQA